MKQLFLYVYYRISKAYRDVFGIEDAPGYLLIQSCYSWGLLVLITALCAYTLAFETVVFWKLGIKTGDWLILVTFLPFGLFYFFAERFLGDLKNRFKQLEKKYKNEKLSVFKGILVFVFVVLSFVCYFVALSICR